jgi:hypothetical protein
VTDDSSKRMRDDPSERDDLRAALLAARGVPADRLEAVRARLSAAPTGRAWWHRAQTIVVSIVLVLPVIGVLVADAPEPPRPAVLPEPIERPRATSSDPAPSVRESPPAPPVESSLAPAVEEPHPARPAPAVRRSEPAPHDTESGPTEVQLLTRARSLAGGDPAGARALLAQHRARFARGLLVEEREALSIDVLLAEGRRDDARAALDRFAARFPNSPHSERLARMLRAP